MKPQSPHSPHRERRRAGDRAEEGVGMGGRGRGDLLETSVSTFPTQGAEKGGGQGGGRGRDGGTGTGRPA